MEARKLDYYDYSNQHHTNQVKVEKKKLKPRREKSVSNIGFKSMAILGIVLLFSLCFAILKGYATISALQQEIVELEKQKAYLTSYKAEINAEIESIKASAEIQDEAKFKLGMIYPGDENVVYVSIGDSTIKSSGKKNNWIRFLTIVSNGL